MRESQDKYDCTYPIYLSPVQRLWVIKIGDQLVDEQNQIHEVIQVRRSPVPGEKPTIVTKIIPADAETNHVHSGVRLPSDY